MLTPDASGLRKAINLKEQSVFVNGIRINLNKTTYRLVEALCLARGLPLSDDALMQCLYDEDIHGDRDEGNIKVHRKKLMDSVRNVGADPAKFFVNKVGFGSRLRTNSAITEKFKIGPVVFDATLGEISCNGRIIDLPRLENSILALLARKKGNSISLDSIKISCGIVSIESLKALVYYIRKKFDSLGTPLPLVTGEYGYILQDAQPFSPKSAVSQER